MRRLTLLLLLALAACGRTITGPPTCVRYRSIAVPIRDTAGDSVAVISFVQCIEWRQ